MLILYYGATQSDLHAAVFAIVSYFIGAIPGILRLLGLYTPLVGIAIVVVEIWTGLADQDRGPLSAVVVAILGATLAMIGPGAWSLDARLFGKKHIRIPGGESLWGKLTYAASEGKAYCVDYSIVEPEKKLHPKKFVHVHRSTVASLTWIREVTSMPGGSLNNRLKDARSFELKVARYRVSDVLIFW